MQKPMVQLSHLNKQYGGLTAVDDVSLTVNAGDFYALLGPNGAGKTTIIGMLCDLVRPTSGKLEVNGFDYASDKQAAKACIGVVPQEINLNSFETPKATLFQQAEFYGLRPRMVRERIEFLVEKLDLQSKYHARVYQLSGGMKRRLMIARALVNSPKLLLLDEPTAGVDVEIRQSMWSFLNDENTKGLTIVLTTHYLEEAEQLCQRVGMLHHGKLISEGKMSDLLNQLCTENFEVECDSSLDGLDMSAFTVSKRAQCSVVLGIKQSQSIQDVIDCFNQSGVKISRVTHQRGRLEQLFSELVSKTGGNDDC